MATTIPRPPVSCRDDFGALLASSSSLLSSARVRPHMTPTQSLGGTFSGGVPAATATATGTPLTKTIRELSVASGVVGGNVNGSYAMDTDSSAAGAYRLLAREGGYDMAGVSRSTREYLQDAYTPVASTTSQNNIQTVESQTTQTTHGTLEEVLNARTQTVIRSTLLQTREQIHDQCVTLRRNREGEEWEGEKHSLLRRLAGYREVTLETPEFPMLGSYGGEVTMGGGAPTPYAARRAGRERVNDEQQDGDTLKLNGDGNARFGGGSKLSEAQRRHAAIVTKYHQDRRGRGNNGGRNDDDLFAQFGTLAKDLANAASVTGDSRVADSYGACGNAWTMLSSMAGNGSNGINGNGATNTYNDVHQRGLGTLSHYCRHFRHVVTNRVRSTLSHHSGGPPHGLAQDLAAYLDLEYGMSSGNNPQSLWPRLYLSLRCGDPAAALETARLFSVDPAVMALLQLLQTSTQTQHSPLSSDAILPLFQIDERDAALTAARTNLLHAFQTAKARLLTQTNVNPEDAYQVATLALLTHAEPLTTALPANNSIVSTMEDYLFASLWNCAKPQSTGGIATLGTNLQHWGPAYFEDDSSNSVTNVSPSGGWAYAVPLLAAQQFHTALTYLAETGGTAGLLQASHLGLALFEEGVPLVDVEPANANASSTNSDGGTRLLSSLLVSYTASLQKVAPETAVEYLVLVPDAGPTSTSNNNERDLQGQNRPSLTIGRQARKQIQRLLLETRAFSLLAGRVSSDGKREGGILSEHFSGMNASTSPASLSSLLSDAAQESLQQGSVSDAADLLALAGRYGALLSLLNRELANLLIVPPQQSKGGSSDVAAAGDAQTRQFWRDAALRFHSAHIANGRTHVLEVLEAEDNLALGSTFQLIMNLMVYFDRCHEGLWEEAWLLLDNLQLLPRSENEISRYVDTFHSFDSVVKQSFHNIVLGAMEALHNQHMMLKSVGGGIVPSNTSNNVPTAFAGTVEQRLFELRRRARVLVTFAGLIPMHSVDTKSRIAQMEAFMM